MKSTEGKRRKELCRFEIPGLGLGVYTVPMG